MLPVPSHHARKQISGPQRRRRTGLRRSGDRAPLRRMVQGGRRETPTIAHIAKPDRARPAQREHCEPALSVEPALWATDRHLARERTSSKTALSQKRSPPLRPHQVPFVTHRRPWKGPLLADALPSKSSALAAARRESSDLQRRIEIKGRAFVKPWEATLWAQRNRLPVVAQIRDATVKPSLQESPPLGAGRFNLWGRADRRRPT